MPYRVVERPDTGTLYIEGTYRPAGSKVGRRVRVRASTDDRRLAEQEAVLLEAQHLAIAYHGPRRSTHTFAEAVVSYMKHAERSPGTAAYCTRLLAHFGPGIGLADIDQEAFDKARMILRQPASAGSVIRLGRILTAVMNHAAKRRWCDPLSLDLPSAPKGRTAVFLPCQAEAMVAGADERVRPLFHTLFCCGPRLGEALALEWADVDLFAGRAMLWEGETKSGARRVMNLPPASIAMLASLPHRSGRVFRSRLKDVDGELMGYRLSQDGGGGQIRKVWGKALPDGCEALTPHSARHSWASWHYALNRDLLSLKAEGGWSSVEMVERYAHILPAGHEAAIRRFWGIGEMVVVGRRA